MLFARFSAVCYNKGKALQSSEKYDPMLMHDSKRDVANLLHEEAEVRSVREFVRQKQQQQAQQKQNKKKRRDSWER